MAQYKYSRDDYYRIMNTPCIDVALALGMEINEEGSNAKAWKINGDQGLCIFRDGNFWYRFSDDKGGFPIDLVKDKLGYDDEQALDFIAKHSGVSKQTQYSTHTSAYPPRPRWLGAEKVCVNNEVERLKRMKANHYHQQKAFEYDISERYPNLISKKEASLDKVRKDIEFIGKNLKREGDNFEITLGGKTYEDRKKAGEALSALINNFQDAPESREFLEKEIGNYSGFKLFAIRQGTDIMLRLDGVGRYFCDYSFNGYDGIARISNLYDRIPAQEETLKREIEEAQKQLANAKLQYGKPFPFEKELRYMTERQSQIFELEFDEQEDVVLDEENNSEEDEDMGM